MGAAFSKEVKDCCNSRNGRSTHVARRVLARGQLHSGLWHEAEASAVKGVASSTRLVSTTSEPPEVDLVYTWVSEPSKDALDEILHTCGKVRSGYDHARTGEGYMNAQRFRDMDTLRHSLRSALMFLPWIRTIFVVTNGVFPCWLKETGKIRFVRHEDIFPDRSHLPTYNSEAIEVNLHRIPGLSELFIYANDDFLFAKPISRDHFFGGSPLAPRTHTTHAKLSRHAGRACHTSCPPHAPHTAHAKHTT